MHSHDRKLHRPFDVPSIFRWLEKKADDLVIVRFGVFGYVATQLYRNSAPLVDFAAMAHVVQVDPALGDIVFVEHTKIAHAELEFRATGQALVGEMTPA